MVYRGGGVHRCHDFADELDRAIALLIEFPHIGAPAGHDTRALLLHGFPYSLIYRVRTDAIRIIAIAHQSRRPGYWAERR